jgi:hypothetical protein
VLGDTWRRGAALTILLAASAATAQDRVETQNAPPVAVGGFRYQHISPHTHMNVCEAAKCVPGSRVSYILAPGNFNPSFERYKDERERVAEALRGRAPAGSTISFDPPEQTTGRIFTLFKSRRADMLADGKKSFVLSQRLHSAHLPADIISSSTDNKAAEANMALCTLPIMLLSQRKEEATKCP